MSNTTAERILVEVTALKSDIETLKNDVKAIKAVNVSELLDNKMNELHALIEALTITVNNMAAAQGGAKKQVKQVEAGAPETNEKEKATSSPKTSESTTTTKKGAAKRTIVTYVNEQKTTEAFKKKYLTEEVKKKLGKSTGGSNIIEILKSDFAALHEALVSEYKANEKSDE